MTADAIRVVEVPWQPTEEMWGGLARDIVFFLYGYDAPHYGSRLHKHLRSAGREIPAWLLTEIPDEDHTPPKGTFAACIYKAMLEAAPKSADHEARELALAEAVAALQEYKEISEAVGVEMSLENAALRERAERAEAERDRLRDALEQIAGECGSGSEDGTPNDPDDPELHQHSRASGIQWMAAIVFAQAVAALPPAPTTEGKV